MLQFDTKYYYEVGLENTTRKFWFVTPPKPGPDVPYTFGLIGNVPMTAYIFFLLILVGELLSVLKSLEMAMLYIFHLRACILDLH